MKTIYALLALAAIGLSGCWTFNETPYPDVTVPQATSTNLITVIGFEAVVVEHQAIHSYRPIYIPGHYGRHHYHPGYYDYAPNVDYIAQYRPTDAYLHRAKDILEKAGFRLGVEILADYVVEVDFEGPYPSQEDTMTKLAWNVGTLFFCDYGADKWTAKLRIRNAKTGELVHHNDFTEIYEAKAFGLIPIFSASSCEKITSTAMQSRCLSALTDRAIADAAAFLSRR